MKTIINSKKFLVVAALGLGLCSCVYSADNEVALNSSPTEDSPYASVLEHSSRKANVIKNFDTNYTINATLLSPEFKSAFTKRLTEVYRQTGKAFEEADSKTGFFISIFSPDHNTTDLTNPYHWNIFLETKEGPLKPALVKKVNDKIRWQAFFDYTTPWSDEYVIVFDAGVTNPQSPDLVANAPTVLTFANADAQVRLSW